MKHGTYVGPIEALKGKTALLMPDRQDPSRWLAQFDEMGLVNPEAPPLCVDAEQGTMVKWDLGHGWHVFGPDDFELDPGG